MKKVIIKNKQGIIGWGAEMLDPTQWIADCIASNAWGKPERWVLHKDEPMAEAYDEADVLEERIVEDMPAVDPVLISEAIPGSPAVMDEAGNIVQAEIPETPAVYSEAIPARTHKEVKLKAEYLVEILNLEEDSDWLLQQCHAKRMVEYPSLGEFADAYVKLQSGDSSQMEAYVAKCIEVKQKYPKP